MAELAALIDPLGQHRPAGQGRLSVRCPAHEDNTPSLTVWVDVRGKAAFNCHAGCGHTQIVNALPTDVRSRIETTWKTGTTAQVVVLRPTHTPAPATTPTQPTIEAEYPYIGEDGQTVHYLVRRFTGKNYRQFHKVADKILAGRGPAPLIPYRLPDVLAAIRAGDPIYIVEGEKDADTLAALGLTATCNVGGAGKWVDDYDQWFTNAKTIYILPDNDKPGREHGRQIAEHLPQATIVNLPNLPEKGDVTDWLQTHTIDELHAAIANPAPAEPEFNIATGDIIFTVPLEVESIWGTGQESLWAVGEPLMIYGPTGVGKTTLAGRLLLALIGVDPPELLGHPVTPLPDDRTALYIAADRPRQAMRSLRRMAPYEAAYTLAQRLRIEHQRQLWASDTDPQMLYRAAIQTNAAVIFIDSGKDLAGGPLKDEGPAKALMDAIQVCIANGVDVALLHHPRKSTQESGGKRELDLDDVYGSAWLTAGSGSVLLVAGNPGSGLFKVEQLKAPATFLPPMEVAVNYQTGRVERRTTRDLEQWLENHGGPVTIRQATAYQYTLTEEEVDTESAAYKDLRRRLEALVADGRVERTTGKPNKYRWVGAMHVVVGGVE